MIHHLMRQAKARGSLNAATMAWRCSLLAFSILLIGGCDDTHTSTWKECWVDAHGEVIHEQCCETTCEYDDDCYYYYWGDCDVDCTETCYNNVSTPVATVVYMTPGPRSPRHPTPTATPNM